MLKSLDRMHEILNLVFFFFFYKKTHLTLDKINKVRHNEIQCIRTFPIHVLKITQATKQLSFF
jgi:hypothetical protein